MHALRQLGQSVPEGQGLLQKAKPYIALYLHWAGRYKGLSKGSKTVLQNNCIQCIPGQDLNIQLLMDVFGSVLT